MSTMTATQPVFRCVDLVGSDSSPDRVTIGTSEYAPVALYLTYEDGIAVKASLECSRVTILGVDWEYTRTLPFDVNEDWVQNIARAHQPSNQE